MLWNGVISKRREKALFFFGYCEIYSKQADSNAGVSAMIRKKRVLSGALQACLVRPFINYYKAYENIRVPLCSRFLKRIDDIV